VVSKKTKHAIAAEIGLQMPHSEETLEYLKNNYIGLYMLLKHLDDISEMQFTDFMILVCSGQGRDYYSCPLCNDLKIYSTAFGYAKKHFESHIFDIEEILNRDRSQFDKWD